MGKCRFHEVVQLAVENIIRCRAGHAGAQVLDQLIGLQDVGADLVAPADVRLGGRFGAGRVFALLQLGLQRRGVVAVLQTQADLAKRPCQLADAREE